jgi:mono/diheme cytochrome c family protein
MLVGMGGLLLAAQRASDRAAPQAEQVERGKYLVEHVAQCVQCHTPRREDGQLDRRRLFEGARIPVESPFANQPWALRAPRLAGLAGWSEEQITTLLETGRRPDGRAPRPPMPAYRMTAEDATAVVAYLRSLHGAG